MGLDVNENRNLRECKNKTKMKNGVKCKSNGRQKEQMQTHSMVKWCAGVKEKVCVQKAKEFVRHERSKANTLSMRETT